MAYRIRRIHRTFRIFSLLTILFPVLSFAAWEWRNPFPQGYPLYGMAYGNGSYVYIGGSGLIHTSTHGAVDSGIPGDLHGVGFANGTFVAVGECNAILTSLDGAVWTPRPTDIPESYNTLWATAYGNGKWVAVGGPYVVTSVDDGATWQTKFINPQQSFLYGVIFANGLFAVVGDAGNIFTSPDGLTWTDRSIPDPYAWYDLRAVVYSGDMFVAISLWGPMVGSPDGITWTNTTGISDGNGTTSSLAYGNGVFVAISTWGIYMSSDLLTWTNHYSGNDISMVAYVNNRFIAIGTRMLESTDGIVWTEAVPYLTGAPIGTIAFGNGFFLALASGFYFEGITFLIASPDGVTWTRLPSVSSDLNTARIKFVNGNFYLFCCGYLLRSADGMNWTTLIADPDQESLCFRDLIYANGMYVLVGGSTIRTSTDGINWTERWSGPYLPFESVAFGNGIFVVVTKNLWSFDNRTATSPDGLTWTDYYTQGFSKVVFANGYFVAIGGNYCCGVDYKQICTSVDGKGWSSRIELDENSILDIIHTEDGIVALSGATIYDSWDGIAWTELDLPPALTLAMAHGQNSYVLVGLSGTILQGNPFPAASASKFLPFSDYFPLIPGKSWKYVLSDGGTQTQTVMPEPIMVEGVETMVIKDLQSGSLSYHTSNEEGIYLHGYFLPKVKVTKSKKRDIQVTFVPPIQWAGRVAGPGQTLHTQGTVRYNIDEFGQFDYTYSADFTMEGPETLIVPAGTFEALKLSYSLRIHVASETGAMFLAKGAGLLKEDYSESFGSLVTRELVSMRDSLMDLAITRIKPPKVISLGPYISSKAGEVKVVIQNRGLMSETIEDADALAKLVTLKVESLGICPNPEPHLVSPRKTFPINVASKKSLTLAYDVTFNCTNDPVKTTSTNPGHSDYRYSASVNRSVLDGVEDNHPDDDICPRTVTPPYEIDTNPDGTIKDKGCGALKPDKTYGGEVLTDVVAK